MEEGKPLVGVHSVGYIDVRDGGVWFVARINRTLADIADDTEAEPLGGNVGDRGHFQEVVVKRWFEVL